MRPILLGSVLLLMLARAAHAQDGDYDSGYNDGAQGIGPASISPAYNAGYYDAYSDQQSITDMQQQDAADNDRFQAIMQQEHCVGMPAGTERCP